jgi:glycosyltransferase involved in cell wall biosynthesis
MSTAKHFPQIVIDGVFFQIAHTGIARVWTSLLHEWSANGFAEHLVVLDRGDTAPRLDGIRYRTIPRYDYGLTGNDAGHLQTLCDEEQADVFVSTYYTAPLTTPSVFVAYDMIPEVYGHELDAPMWREKHYGIQHAAAHVAISHSTARDLVKFFPELDLSAVAVAYPGAEAAFHPASADEIEQFRKMRGLEKPYFLLVGNRTGFNGYKNAALFFQALAALLARERFAVVCAGGSPALEAELQPFVDGAAVHLLTLSDDELRAAYSGALALVYPSRYEGFGLPVLEAMACSCPVITCRNSSLSEVAGDAALYTLEEDVTAMGSALQRVQQEETRRALCAAGLEQAAKFSWRNMATILADVLRRAAAEGRRPARLWSEFRRVQATAQKCEAMERELLQMRTEFFQNHKELWEAKRLIAHMQASKFWKMRSALVDSRNAMARLAGQWLPRRAG